MSVPPINENIPPADEHPRQINAPQGAFEAIWSIVEKHRFTRGCAIGCLLIIVPLFALWSTMPEDIKKEIINSFKGKIRWSQLGATFPGFEVASHKRQVDLSDWKPAEDGKGVDVAIFTDSFTVRKTRPDIKYFCITAGSTGSKPEVRSNTNHDIQVYDMSEADFVGWPKMNNQIIAAADVSTEAPDKEFILGLTTKRIGGFQDPKAGWCSVGIWHPTREFEYHVIFPKSKIGRNIRLKKAFFNNNETLKEIPIDKEDFRINGNQLTWRMKNPQIGYAYQITWDW
jgi:hypothetical protein